MRVGENPAKKINRIPKPQRITVAVLSYIPFLNGYYRECLDVLKLCLQSIWNNTDLAYDLLVFDNGSCPEAKEFLFESQRAKKIQYLLFSEKNIGKGGAWNVIFSCAPGEIIAYCDSDAFFYKGWLSACVKVLETYPKVGMVTARPMRTRAELFSSTIKWAENNKNVKLEKGQILNYEEFHDFAITLGYSEERIHEMYQSTIDYRITYKGLPSFIGANHFQFVSWKNTLNQFIPLKMTKPLGQVQLLDKLINESGYLRLSTHQSLVQNMSNHVPNDVRQDIDDNKMKFAIKNLPLIRRTLLYLHDKIFRIYFES